MSALHYQPVPTIAQRRALAADHAKRYREIQEATADFRVVQLRYEERQPEPCQFCAVESDEASDGSLIRFIAMSVGSLGVWAAVCYAMWWFAPKAADLITWILEKHA